MPFVIISEKDAPAPPVKLESPLTQASLRALSGLKRGKVARIVPEGEESTRGIKQSIARISRREDKPVVMWEVDNVVYAKLKF